MSMLACLTIVLEHNFVLYANANAKAKAKANANANAKAKATQKLFASAGEKVCMYDGNIWTSLKGMCAESGCAKLVIILADIVPGASAMGSATV